MEDEIDGEALTEPEALEGRSRSHSLGNVVPQARYMKNKGVELEQ